MDSADIEIHCHLQQIRQFHRKMFVTGTKRCRDDEDLEEEQVFKVSVGFKKERNDSSSNSSSSNSVEQFF